MLNFAHIKFELMLDLNANAEKIGLKKRQYDENGMTVDWEDGEVEIEGFDSAKNEQFVIYYNYIKRTGSIRYYNGEINRFSLLEG
jgi:hypothetical protein